MSRKLTRTDIAKAVGVSPSTVSRALAGSALLPKSTIAQVRKVASRMGYRPSVLGRRLAANRSFQIGFVLPLGLHRKGPLQMSYYSTILDGMVSGAYPRGYSVSLHPYEQEDAASASRLADIVAERHVDGLVILGLTQRSCIPGTLLSAGVPFVLIGARPEGDGISSVNCNPAPAIRGMLDALRGGSYRRLYFVHGNLQYYDAVAQRRALEDELGERPFESVEILEGDYSRSSGYKAAERILSSSRRDGFKECVFLANDRMATGFYRYCHERGIRIPDRIGVVGSDGDEAATALHPDLCTMLQPRIEMGRAAAGILIDACEDRRSSSRCMMIDESFLKGKSI